eukprot:11037166-Alexandrium_andersonii.AAC.1
MSHVGPHDGPMTLGRQWPGFIQINRTLGAGPVQRLVFLVARWRHDLASLQTSNHDLFAQQQLAHRLIDRTWGRGLHAFNPCVAVSRAPAGAKGRR